MGDNKTPKNETPKIKVGWVGYAAFFFAIIIFSGIFSSSDTWLKVFDFNVLNGKFGTIPPGAEKALDFRGAGGTGARDGFLFAIELIPAVILALGIVNVIDGLGGLRAAQKLMTPILKPLLGIPGITALASIANMQSTDAAAGMVKARSPTMNAPFSSPIRQVPQPSSRTTSHLAQLSSVSCWHQSLFQSSSCSSSRLSVAI